MDVPDVDHRLRLLRAPLLLQPVLRLPQRAHHHQPDHDPGGGVADRALHGASAAGEEVQGVGARVLAEPGALQREGARADIHLRQRRRRLRQRQRLRRRHRQHRQGLLQAQHLILHQPAPHHHHPGVGIRMGRVAEEVRGGTGAHVVAAESGAGFSHESDAREGESSDDAGQVLPDRAHLQLRVVRGPGLPVPDADGHLVGVLGVPRFDHDAADRVRHERARRRRRHPRLDHGGLLPGQPARVALLRHRQRLRRLRALRLHHAARLLLGAQPLRRQHVPSLLQRPLHRVRPALQHLRHRQRQVRHRHGRLREAREDPPQPLLRRQLRARLRHHRRHLVPCHPLLRKGDVPEVPGVVQGQGGRAHEADEEVRGHTKLVVLPPAHGVHGVGDGALHRVQGGGPAAVVGPPLGLRRGLRLHAPHQCHHRNHEHDSRVEYHHRVLLGADHAGEADCQRVFQGLRLHEHEPGRLLPYRLQARPLHEDSPKIHVPSSVHRDGHCVDGEHDSGVVAADDGAAHLREGHAPGGQPVDVPGRPRLLRRVRDLGPGRPAPHLRAPGLLQRAQLVLPRRAARPPGGVAGGEGGAPARRVDQPRQHARDPGRHGQHAARVGAQLHVVVLRRHRVQLLRVPVPERVVEAVQLRAVRGHGRRGGHHGGAHLLRAHQLREAARLVGFQGRALRPRHLPHRQGRRGGRLPRPLIIHSTRTLARSSCSLSIGGRFRRTTVLFASLCLRLFILEDSRGVCFWLFILVLVTSCKHLRKICLNSFVHSEHM